MRYIGPSESYSNCAFRIMNSIKNPELFDNAQQITSQYHAHDTFLYGYMKDPFSLSVGFYHKSTDYYNTFIWSTTGSDGKPIIIKHFVLTGTGYAELEITQIYFKNDAGQENAICLRTTQQSTSFYYAKPPVKSNIAANKSDSTSCYYTQSQIGPNFLDIITLTYQKTSFYKNYYRCISIRQPKCDFGKEIFEHMFNETDIKNHDDFIQIMSAIHINLNYQELVNFGNKIIENESKFKNLLWFNDAGDIFKQEGTLKYVLSKIVVRDNDV